MLAPPSAQAAIGGCLGVSDSSLTILVEVRHWAERAYLLIFAPDSSYRLLSGAQPHSCLLAQYDKAADRIAERSPHEDIRDEMSV